MGVVYLVQAGKSLGALKLIRPQLADDEEFRARFRREVEAGRAVSGPYTARFIDAQLDGPAPYLVTEYVDGPSLAEAVADGGPFSFDAVVGLASGLAQALRAVHAAGVIHRDLKPSNVLIGPTGPRIIDFGIARAMEGTSVTRTGMSVGSPSWMAPEAARGESVSQATDVFAWGCVVMFAATGRGPFGEGRPEAILYRIVHEEPDLSGLDARLVPVVRAALARDPESRPSTSDLIGALSEALAGGEPDPAEIGTAVRTRTDLLVADGRPDITTPVAVAGPWRKRWVIAAAAIIGLAAIGGTVVLTGGFGMHIHPSVLRTTTTTRGPATTSSSTTSTIAPTTSAPQTSSTSTSLAATTTSTSTSIATGDQTVTASVPIVACPTTWATPGNTPAALPSSVTLSLPQSLVGRVTDYSDQQEIMQLIGPKGWLCTAGYGADGGGGIQVYPPGERPPSGGAFSPQSGEAIESHETSACLFCRLDQACPLFPSAAAALASQGQTFSCPYTKPVGEQSTQLSSTVAAFEDPPGVAGDGDPSGGPYPANGVMIYGPGSVMDGSWVETCTLPSSEHAVCTLSLDEFVSLYKNN
jgi:serine/threonine protein kinase